MPLYVRRHNGWPYGKIFPDEAICVRRVLFNGIAWSNRLASNSLLEALVFAHRIYKDAISQFENITIPENIPDWDEKGVQLSNEDILVTHNVREMQKLMNDYVGIVRSDFRLDRAMRRLADVWRNRRFLQTHKVISKALWIKEPYTGFLSCSKISHVKERKPGAALTTDYPKHADVIEDTVFFEKYYRHMISSRFNYRVLLPYFCLLLFGRHIHCSL